MAGQVGGQSASGAESALRDSVRQAVDPVVTAAGLYLEDVSVSRAGARSVVRVVLDLPEDRQGSLDLDTVAEVSRPVSDALDEVAALRGAYTLEVSTPGTDRPLTQERHFRRALGRLVRLVLSDGGTVEGRLVGAQDELVLDVTDTRGRTTARTVPFATVVRGQVQVELRRALTADLPELENDDPTAASRGDDEEA
ncbi:ribosome maturation factor RimP [Cellulosimicrobium terreum]|nr:ribosome maturation factor RimP [Cellulosimicrobium terreum]